MDTLHVDSIIPVLQVTYTVGAKNETKYSIVAKHLWFCSAVNRPNNIFISKILIYSQLH